MLMGHLHLVFGQWNHLRQLLDSHSRVVVDGQTLSLSDVVAVSHYHAAVSLTLDANIINKVHESTTLLHLKLRQGATIYGITTGFGGSADVRTSDHEELQRGLLQLPKWVFFYLPTKAQIFMAKAILECKPGEGMPFLPPLSEECFSSGSTLCCVAILVSV